MKFSFIIYYAFKSLKRRKLRAFLTIFAVFIGTTLISTMVSLGIGLKDIVVKGLKGAGELTDINVYQNENSTQKLNQEIISSIEQFPGVEKVDPMVTLVAESASFNGFEKSVGSTLVTAVPSLAENTFSLIAGTSFNSSGLANSAIVGENFLKNFSQDSPEIFLGKTISLKFGSNNFDFQIAGVAKSENIWGYGLFIPLSQASQIKKNLSYDSLRIKASSIDQVSTIVEKVKALGLTAVTLDNLIQQVTKYFRLFELALGSFGLVILAVASLGIINTMLMATLERTKEIGIMRAMGATRQDILRVFNFESALIGFIGGTIGIIFSFLINHGLNNIVLSYLSKQNLATDNISVFHLPIWLVIVLISFSTFIGFASGLYPALRASRLNPVDALRSE